MTYYFICFICKKVNYYANYLLERQNMITFVDNCPLTPRMRITDFVRIVKAKYPVFNPELIRAMSERLKYSFRFLMVFCFLNNILFSFIYFNLNISMFTDTLVQ